ncbi:putative protein kinase RLK-Pelle-WAK-LRK10L-1 family [Helianthus annuus]|uniref:Protein kinase domain-containing protein n=1 Tax=Helianthus annuus TaxID=4232 RepID=A0A251UFY9_HELAN|nr:wall-associated receptor kinase-like 20 [Helianthus annuus]KAF5800015.1 putative protein kinase RLK-Pelle-WAK-LRK10L-1 family [Helianthus annuus]KAJ0551388.1 putative protein kinase RLK-Pelle-WAK-LRK10L-1 family [Helianthus annuus]KAJ0564353.1 putative protein kinase RLK-Pelle-WAK-LRK10L-1 family [Helianthus annuus]KAJ0729682.1 putative protein kinase RLK-Pelle-WAK-LRK10L-1 family [Helianthus annuus]KAJ0732418.1 putative protein kinase RLK-Pelle-WAK-LRK10L-1 family [Helianthus annuus]
MLVLIMEVLVSVLVLIAHTGFGRAAVVTCPACGTSHVPYPLSTGPMCGNQSYKVRCDKGALKFDTLNNTYPIISISPKDQQLVIAQSPFLPNTCYTADLPTQGIQLDPSLPFSISLNNTVIFFNCTETMSSFTMDCTPTSPCRAYVNGSPLMSVCRKSPRCCSFYKGSSTSLYSLRLTMNRCRAYKSFVNLNSSLPFNKWPDPAVELVWAPPPEPACTKQAQCEATSTCRDAHDGSRRCLCKSAFLWDAVAGQCVKDLEKARRKRTVLVASTVCVGGIVCLTSIFGLATLIRHRKSKAARKRLAREREKIVGASGIGKLAKVFTSKEIKKATNNFSQTDLLGVGGFGEVYKGVMEDGAIVAVKCAKPGNTKSIDQVLNEVRILCQVNHKNLVRLLGCCVEEEQPFLVYEYIPNGSLFDHLHGHDKRPLTWGERLGIAHDTAEGLAYLHFSASPPIYHRDVKSSNILLDYNMKAKVADFGLSRLAEADVTHVTTCAQGTFGYLDPDYYWNYQLTDKSDVYSFGVLLLEMLTGQKAIDFVRPAEDVNLVAYIKRVVNEERLVDVIDLTLKKHATSLDIEAMKAFGFLAMSCLEERRENRPSMKETSEEIEYIMGVVANTADDNLR